MATSTSLKRRCLRRAYIKARDGGIALSDQLEADFISAYDSVKGGRIGQSVQGGGISKSWIITSEEKPHHYVEAFEELLDLYDTAVLNISPSSDDKSIYDEMMGLLKPATFIAPDYTNLRA